MRKTGSKLPVQIEAEVETLTKLCGGDKLFCLE